ncbi:hypothetical protein GCM10027578_22060 [Spirosoma luteolum]
MVDSYEWLKALGVAAFICRQDGHILIANEKLRVLLGNDYSFEQLTVRELFGSGRDDQESVSMPFLTAIERAQEAEQEVIFQPKSGEPLRLRVSISPLSTQPGESQAVLGTITDLSLLWHKEQELALLKRQKALLPDDSTTSIIFTDRQGLVTYINTAAEHLTGYTFSEAVGKMSLKQFFETQYTEEFIHQMAQDLNLVGLDQLAIVDTYLQKKRYLTGKYRLLTKAGTSLTVSATTYAFTDHSDTVLGYLTKAIDVSYYQHIELDLADKNDKLSLAVQAAKMGIWEHQYETDQTFWDQETYRLYGVNAQQPITWELYLSLIHADDRALFIQQTQEALASDSFHVVLRINRPDTGQLCFIESTGKVLRDDEGRAIRLLGVAQDVTQLYVERSALLASEWRFKHLAEQVNEIFWIRSIEDGRFIYINPAFERCFGLDREILNTDPTQFFEQVFDEDRPKVLAVYKQRSVGPVPYVFRFWNAQGELRWMEASAITFYTSDSVNPVGYRAGVARDITLQREHEQNLNKAIAQEKALTARQSQFITTASHEFRTPLTAICSSAELLHLYLDQLPADPLLPIMARHLTAIFANVRSLTTLIGDTLTISKLDDQGVKVDWQILNVVDFCQSLIQNTLDQRVDNRRVDMIVEGIPKPIYTDPKLLGHILINLVSNAFKFSSQNTVLNLRFENEYLALAVIDRGIGIPTDELASIFDKFYRARNASDHQGTGLGLVICQEYTSLLGGQLTVDSEQGAGTQFTLRLPLSGPSISPSN